jgi:hypothetical protein
MSENLQEQTEAKLLAFIEGELDEAGRAEIERHLEANPKHRKLIEDLSAGRRLLRQLPRESAPQELFEGVESQLERHVLLADAGPAAKVNPETGNLRISHQRRWVRIRAAAAAVIVATGLGIVVYKSLPERGTPNYSVNTPTNSPASTPAEPAENQVVSKKADENETLGSANHGEGLRKSAGRELQHSDNLADRDVAKQQPPLAGERFADDKRKESDELAQRQLRMAEAVDRARKLPAVRELLERADRPGFAGGAGGGSRPTQEQLAEIAGHEPLFLVVSSGDPDQAKREIAQILQQQNARFSTIDSLKREAERLASKAALSENDPAGGMPERGAGRNRPETRGSIAMAKAAAAPGAAAVPMSAAPAPAPAAPAIAPAATPPPSAPPAPIAPATPTPSKKPAAADAANGARNAIDDPALPSAPPGAERSPLPLSPAPESPAPASPGPDSKPAVGIAAADPQSKEHDERVLIVRQIPRSQARYLLARMSEGANGNQMAAMFSRAPGGDGGGGGAGLAANSAANLQAVNPEEPIRAKDGTGHPAPPTRPASYALKQANNLEEKAKFEQQQRQAPAISATKPTNPDAPIAKDDALLLVYKNFKGTSRDMKQPVVLKDGAVYVVGPGNVDVAGLTPAQASEKLTKAMQEKDAKSAGAELRRATADELVALAQNASMRSPVPQNRGMFRRGATNPAELDQTLGVTRLAAGEDHRPGTQPSDGGADPLVDVVIVLQGATSPEEAAGQPPLARFGPPATTPAGPTTAPATRPSR